jgi:hypothetical protein
MYQTKTATQSLGVVAQVVAIITMSLKLAGVDISAEVADVPANVAAGIDAALILAAQATALYGRLRANKQIRGIFKAG